LARVHALVEADWLTPGERLVAGVLERELPDRWEVFVARTLPHASGRFSLDVDFIVVGDHGVYVLEEKHWGGRIFAGEQYWTFEWGETRKSPINQAELCARVLAGNLREALRPHTPQGKGHFVQAAVVLTRDDVSVTGKDPRLDRQVVRLDNLADWLTGMDYRLKDQVSIGPVRDRIIEYLSGCPKSPEVPRRINRFDVVGKRGQEGPIKLFDAVDGHDRYVLKVAEAGHRRDIEHEYGVLKFLAERCPEAVAKPVPPFPWSDGQYWVLAIRLPRGRSLRAWRQQHQDVSADYWTKLMHTAFASLAAIHENDVVHRNINPDHLWITDDGDVLFTSFLVARASVEYTVAEMVREFFPEDPYRPPEVQRSAHYASPLSDVYSLAMTAAYLAIGTDPPAGDKTQWLDTALCFLDQAKRRVIRAALMEDPEQRPRAAAVADALRPPIERLSWQRGQVIEGQYELLDCLGRGGTGETWLAYDRVLQQRVVLKRFHSEALHKKVALPEIRFAHLPCPHVRRVHDIRGWDKPFHLKMEYIEGRPLSSLMTAFLGDLRRCKQFAVEFLAMLEQMERHDVLHRDIKPQNVLCHPDRPEAEFWLIDFGLATLASESKTCLGTPAYQPPEVDMGGAYPPSGDRYAFAAMLYQMYTGELPWPRHADGRLNKGRFARSVDDFHSPEERRFVEALFRALAVDPAQRFASAAEMKQAMIIVPPPNGVGIKRVNEFVDSLRRAFRNTRLGNSENRGLESEFARQTYVTTGLDDVLLPELLAGTYRLVLLCGNPGDGKTAFLQRLHDCIRERGGRVKSADRYGWEAELGGRTYRAVYDASESQGQRSADDVLDEVLTPIVADRGSSHTALIAINDGRMFDFFERRPQFAELWGQIRRYLEGNDDRGDVRVVDLKRRCISANQQASSFVARLLELWTAPEHWSVCEECAAKAVCPIKWNAESLNPKRGAEVVQRLERLLTFVHLRREFRPTIRDVRSLLAYTITADLGCTDVHKMMEGVGPTWLEYLYPNTLFGAREDTDDPLVAQLRDLDPARLAHPILDRLILARSVAQQTTTTETDARTDPLQEIVVGAHGGRHADSTLRSVLGEAQRSARTEQEFHRLRRTWVRRLYFEADAEKLQELGFASPSDLLPYRHLEEYEAFLSGREPLDRMLRRLARGISLMEGAPEQALGDPGNTTTLAFVLSNLPDASFTVLKLFDLSEFELELPNRSDPVTDSIADSVYLCHKGGARLLVTLDLYELLCRACEGYLVTYEEAQPLLQDLQEFKNILLLQPTRDAVLVRDGQQVRAVVQNNRLVVSPLVPEV